jgi:hypothetical protein
VGHAACGPAAGGAGGGGRGAAAVASFLAAVLTEIYLCGVCSCQEMLRRNGRGQGWGRTVRLTASHSTGGGEAELTAALSTLRQRRAAGRVWARETCGAGAEPWGVGRWAMATRALTAGGGGGGVEEEGGGAIGVSELSIERGGSNDLLVLAIGGVVRLEWGGAGCLWWRGETMAGRRGQMPASAMVVLPKAIARRGFEPLPQADRSLYRLWGPGRPTDWHLPPWTGLTEKSLRFGSSCDDASGGPGTVPSRKARWSVSPMPPLVASGGRASCCGRMARRWTGAASTRAGACRSGCFRARRWCWRRTWPRMPAWTPRTAGRATGWACVGGAARGVRRRRGRRRAAWRSSRRGCGWRWRRRPHGWRPTLRRCVRCRGRARRSLPRPAPRPARSTPFGAGWIVNPNAALRPR